MLGLCLFGDDLVSLQDGSLKQMKDLRSGDKVYSVDKQGQIVKDEIIMMLHGGAKTEAPFYTVTISSNRSVSLTGDHLIITYNKQKKRSHFVAANELKVNDYILMGASHSENLQPQLITSIEVLYKTGFYTPMTYTGTLLVNELAVSCYVKHENMYGEMHALLYPFRLYYYLVKDVLQLSEEPFPFAMRVGTENEGEFYGTQLIRSLHQSKKTIKYLVQNLLLHTFLNI
ncbi:unnamed protein product [Didymodactylos carnosus]|uniref:Hint domain-containing protein n=1 Tax=Didymodactylos carnosus TaxID=1234261 RepID=A0A815UIZ0_9BILA|nr:unnamed protein product [Didymodactylos carnosus]CAF1517738.1 unnamed protein product [Didymodactylos carnosus]CAF3788965.1 unnamed protein product [Didymodactylos carnosus]CAF4377534.1 unnamed protein product [Didymodactylos carnosus]